MPRPNKIMAICLISSLSILLPSQLARADGLMGGGGPQTTTACISPAERILIHNAIQDYLANQGPTEGASAPRKFPFYPLGDIKSPVH